MFSVILKVDYFYQYEFKSMLFVNFVTIFIINKL